MIAEPDAKAQPRRVVVIDPSLFTIPYDDGLCAALDAIGCRTVLLGRNLRTSEMRCSGAAFEPFFYRRIEPWAGRLPTRGFRLLKGIEHTADMARLCRRLARERPDIIHFQWAPLPVIDRRFVPALRRIAPTVLTVHDTTPFNGSPNAALQSIGAASIYAAFDHLVVLTEAGKAQLAARGIPSAMISVIPHGPLVVPQAAPRPRSSDGRRTILIFGKIKPYKGVDLLIEAFALLPDRLRADTRLAIVGEPYMPIEPLRARAAALGISDRISWDLRYVRDDEIGSIIEAADILAFPYRQIDMSGVLVLGLRYAKPVVASAIGAFAELLRDGEHGRLVPPDDVSALRDALAELLADPVRAALMGENVRRLEERIVGWPEVAERTAALYRQLLDRRRREGAGRVAYPQAA
jgi:glycosyltransferase involved in cell wall biosynthesis